MAFRNRDGVSLYSELKSGHGLDMMEEEEVRVGFWVVPNSIWSRWLTKGEEQAIVKNIGHQNIDIEFSKHFNMY